MFSINKAYADSVENFSFAGPEEDLPLTIPSSDLDAVVQEVALKVITASQLRPVLTQMAQRDLSLQDAGYLAVQDLDRKHQLNTPNAIAEAPAEAKGIIGHVVKKLSLEFTQLSTTDLNVLTLLFGIQRISEVARITLVSPPQAVSQEEECEQTLTQLKTLRNQHPEILPEETPEAIKAFVAQVDQSIQTFSYQLAFLKAEKEQKIS